MKYFTTVLLLLSAIFVHGQIIVFDTDNSEIDVTIMPPNDPPMFAVEFPVTYTVSGNNTDITYTNYNFLNADIPAGSIVEDVEFAIGNPGIFYTNSSSQGTTENLPGNYPFISVFFGTYYFTEIGVEEQVSFTIEFSDENNIPFDTITLTANLTLGTANSGPPITFSADTAQAFVNVDPNVPFTYLDLPISYTMTEHPYYPSFVNYKFLAAEIPSGATFSAVEFWIGDFIFYQAVGQGGSLMVLESSETVINMVIEEFDLSSNELSSTLAFTLEFSDENDVPLDTIHLIADLCLNNSDLDIIDYTTPVPFCPDTEVDFSAEDGFASYTWSDGSMGQNATIEVGIDGYVDLQVMDDNGCTGMDFVNLDFSVPAPQPLCFVTVDDDTGKNKILWEKTVGQGTDSFYIYKQGIAVNEYDLLASQPFEDFSEFIDQNSNPLSQSEKYRITAIDGCGVESDVLEAHKTIHLTSNVGINGEVNLIWEAYEGLQYSTFNIYRGSDITTTNLIAQRPSNTFTYTDFDAPSGELFYQIVIEAPEDCDPSRAVSAIRSNFSEAQTVHTNELINSGFQISPNPITSNIELTNIPTSGTIVIHDVLGRVVMRFKVSEGEKMILDMSDLAAGIYGLNLDGVQGAIKLSKI